MIVWTGRLIALIWVKDNCHQNIVTSLGTMTHIPTKFYQFLASSYSVIVQPRTHYRHTQTGADENNNLLRWFAGAQNKHYNIASGAVSVQPERLQAN